MQFEALTIADLKHLANDPSFWRAPVLPISPQRARSQAANPRSKDTDVALLLARADGELVAYLGIMPDQIDLGSGPQRLGWLTTWWVSPRHAASAIGAMLLYQAMRHYQKQIGVASFTPSAARIFEASGLFRPLATLVGIEARIRSDLYEMIRERFRGSCPETAPARAVPEIRAETLSRPRGRAKQLVWGAAKWTIRATCSLLDSAVEWIARRKLARWHLRQSDRLTGLATRSASTWDDDADAFAEEVRGAEYTRRAKAEFDWVLGQSWIDVGPAAEELQTRYFFSVAARHFERVVLKLAGPDGTLAAVLVLKLRDGLLTAPYAFIRRGCDVQASLAVIEYGLAHGVVGVQTYDARLIEAWSTLSVPWLSVRRREQQVILSRFTDATADDHTRRFHDGDGDGSFT